MSKIAEDFISVRSLITLGAFFLAYKIMWYGLEVPPFLSHIIDVLLGFWFGQKVGQAMAQKKEGT